MSEIESLSNERLEEIASAIEVVARRTGFERRIEIGRIVFEQIFASDPRACTDAAAPRQWSFRKLAALLDGTIGKSELHRCVGVHQVCQRLTYVPTSGHLTVSHVDAVLGLDAAAQDELLRLAISQRITVRQLRQLRRNLCSAPAAASDVYLTSLARRASRRGRRTSEAFALLLRGIRRDTSHLPASDAAELMKCVAALESACAEVRHSLSSRSSARESAA